ncbi:hypothetical protein OG417_09485 [Actinoallomurus sp. NBC_01490]|uniref:hypothetical protein n=1 Tax=Actinoallomurus sp. NBC_01490 TaxID=2903557 RepID=UPI002E357D6D|nr:hypothetical protein [Actinoallomurus sp. NBC_01490]
MECAAGPPGRWFVTLKSGSTLEVWAHTYTEETGQYLFCAFISASPEEEQHIEVANPSRVPGSVAIAVLAKVPAREVASIEGPVDLGDEADTGI